MAELHAECLCGAIKYSVKGIMNDIAHCHCSECRKWHGALFRSRTTFPREGFKWLRGEEFVSSYDGLPNAIKTFCKICGSNLVSFYKNNSTLVGVPLAAVEGKLDDVQSYHMFTADKATWYEITDTLPQYKNKPID